MKRMLTERQDSTGDGIGPYVDRRAQRAVDQARRQSITRKTDISVTVESTRPTLSAQPQIAEEDREMSDADSDAEQEEENDCNAEQSVIQAREQPSRRHDQVINQQIIAAWQQGHRLDPEIEQFLKEQSEQGTLDANLDVVSNFHPRALRGYLRPGNGGAAAAVPTPRAAA